MSLDVSTQIEIERPANEVAAYAFEPANDPKWIGGISEATLLTPRPIGMGTQVRRLAKFLWKKIDYILEVVEFRPDREMVMKSIKSPFPMRVTYRFDIVSANRTGATVRVEGMAKGFYGLGDFLMAPMVRRNITKDVRRLKRLLERAP